MRATVVAGVLLVVGAVAGCSSGSHTEPGSPPATSLAPISSGAASSAAAPSTSAAAPATSAAAAAGGACTDGQLKLTSVRGQGAAGTFLGDAEFALVGSTPCTVTGYGGLDVYASDGVHHATRTTLYAQGPQGTVTVTPSRGASLVFTWNEGRSTNCPAISKLVVTAPGLHDSTTEPYSALGFSTQLCSEPTIAYATVTPAGAATGAPATSAATSGTKPCADGQVKLGVVDGQPSAGEQSASAHFALVGRTPCTLTGYAGLDVQTSSGVQHAARGGKIIAQQGSAAVVTLTASQQAVVPFGWAYSAADTSTCPQIQGFLITPPGLHTALKAPPVKGDSEPLCMPPPQVGYVEKATG